MRRRPSDEGASLVFALLIVLLGAALTGAIAEFGFANVKATESYSARQRLDTALDLGLQAAIANLPSGAPCGTGTSPLTLPDVDGVPDALDASQLAGPPAAIEDYVTCTFSGGTYAITVDAYGDQAQCNGSEPFELDAGVAETTVQSPVTVSSDSGYFEDEVPTVTSSYLTPITPCQSFPGT